YSSDSFREKSRSRICSTIPPARSPERTSSTRLPRYLNRVIAGCGKARRLDVAYQICLPNQTSLDVGHLAMPASRSTLRPRHLSLQGASTNPELPESPTNGRIVW